MLAAVEVLAAVGMVVAVEMLVAVVAAEELEVAAAEAAAVEAAAEAAVQAAAEAVEVAAAAVDDEEAAVVEETGTVAEVGCVLMGMVMVDEDAAERGAAAVPTGGQPPPLVLVPVPVGPRTWVAGCGGRFSSSPRVRSRLST